MNNLILGIDIGTTGCKSTVYNIKGEKIISGYKEYSLSHPKPNWAEIDPEIWWEAVIYTMKSVLSRKVNLSNIKSIGISCTNALIAVNKKGKPLRKAIMQIDQRTNKEMDWIKNNLSEDEIFKITGNRVAPGTFSAPIILWLKKNEPDIFAETYKFLVPTGYIVNKLTGEFTIDPSRASTTMLFDIESKKWSTKLIQNMKISRDKLPEILPSDNIAGYVTKNAAHLTGLKEGTHIATGCMDTVAAALGSGIVEPGDVFSILGTVGRLGVCINEPSFDNRFINCCHGVPGQWLSMAAINGTGASYRWFKNNFAQLETSWSQIKELDPYEILNDLASKSPPGAKGLIYLPYIAAERSPIWSHNAKGAFLGINYIHDKSDFVRALLEGISYAFKHNLEIFKSKLKIKFEDLTITGGGAKSNLWRQILADILNLNILLPDNIETETLGAAYLAGKASGLIEEKEIFQPKVIDKKVPNQNNHNIYNGLYDIYKHLHINLSDINKKINYIQNQYY